MLTELIRCLRHGSVRGEWDQPNEIPTGLLRERDAGLIFLRNRRDDRPPRTVAHEEEQN